MVKLKNSSDIEMCFAVALSQTYLELLRLLAYPTSIGSHPERELLYTQQSTVSFVGGKEQTRWVQFIHTELLGKVVDPQEAS